METISNVLFVLAAAFIVMQFGVFTLVHGMSAGGQVKKAEASFFHTWFAAVLAIAAVVIR